MRTPKKEIDKRYEEKHKAERKAKNGTFGTSMLRKDLEQLDAFLQENHFSKVRLIYAGWEALKKEVESNGSGAGNRSADEGESMSKEERNGKRTLYSEL